MAGQTLPVSLDLVTYARTDLVRQFRWIRSDQQPQDFTGWSAEFLIGPGRGFAALDLGTGGPGVTLGSNGLIDIHLTATQTDGLPAGDLYYVLDLTDPGGLVTRFLRGRITVVDELEPLP